MPSRLAGLVPGSAGGKGPIPPGVLIPSRVGTLSLAVVAHPDHLVAVADAAAAEGTGKVYQTCTEAPACRISAGRPPLAFKSGRGGFARGSVGSR
eukprot:8446043-Pyramimonas_sp.AAC.1